MQRFSPIPRRFDPLPGHMDCRDRSESSLRATAKVTPAAFRSPEAYRLSLSDGRIELLLGSEAAFRFAWQHFEQWRQASPAQTPCGILEDGPALPRRGFMLDVSRCKIPTMEHFRSIICTLASHRFNELQLYTEHSFAYAGHETVWRDSSPLTPNEIRNLRRWCEEAGITLVPNQNSFGHFERWLKHPDYLHLAECPDGFRSPWGDWRSIGSVLQPNAESAAFLHDLHDQLLPLFEGVDRFNIGCDETFELGQGHSKALCDARSRQAVYTDFVAALADRVNERYGLRCQFWADILLQDPAWLQKLRPDMIALNWGYEADHPFEQECGLLQEAGLSFYVCPGTSSWNSFGGRTDNMLTNIEGAIRSGLAHGAEGLLLTDWGDNGHLQPWEVSLPAIAWAGALAWNPETAERPVEDTWLRLGRICNDLSWQPANANALFRMFQNAEGTENVPTRELQAVLEQIRTTRAPDPRQAQVLRNLALGACSELKRRGIGVRIAEAWREAPREHARLWREQNREGGLAESLGTYKTVAHVCDLPKEYLIP